MVLQAMMDGTDPKSQLANKFVSGGRLNSRNTIDELMAVGCNGSICFGPSGIQTSNVDENNADIDFSVQTEVDLTNLYWRELGSTSWTPELDVTPPFALTGLSACSECEFYLESNCGGDMCNPSSSQTFATLGSGTTEACNDVLVDEDDSGIDEDYANYVSVYPNPSNSLINFYVTHPSVKSLVVIDIIGKEVFKTTITGELTTINLENFRNGSYFYKLLGEDGSTLVSDKIVKVK